MRAGLCTVSAPLAACSPAGALPPAARFLALHLLHQQTIYFIVQAKSRVRELYHQTCLHFAQQGMLDTDLFGLALICDGEYLFAELDSKLSKYAPKSWRSSHSHGLDANGRPALAFYFRVQYYVDSPLLLRDETTRHHYYLQLRLNMAAGNAGENTTILSGLALQADLDNRNENTIFKPEDYVPQNMREPSAIRTIENVHRSLRNVPKEEARSRFIADACQIQEPVNAHVFKLRASKNEACPGSLLLAVCARGLQVSPENNPPSMFLWSSIGKLSFERKKFEIRTGHEKITLYTTSDEKSRLLLALCKATHQFSMAIAPKLTEAKKLAEEKQKWDGEQRISVISNTSSNTTSGIVSDRVHSEDELEIMITSPPAAPAQSTESLALAHLLDSTPSSSRASAASSLNTGGSLFILPSKEEEDMDCAKQTMSESSAKTIASNGVAGKCTGSSQCSSSCSTVVLTQIQNNKAKGRRPSTSSSLELGYSHTAQNSFISDTTCIETDANAVYAAGVAPSSHTSGVYTMTSSEEYTTSSSEQQYATACGEYSLASEQYSVASEQYSVASEAYSVPSEQYSVASEQSDQYNAQSGEYSAIDAYRAKNCISRVPDEYCITEEYEQYNISSEFISEEDLDDKSATNDKFGIKYNLHKLRLLKSPGKDKSNTQKFVNEDEKAFRQSEEEFKRAISQRDASSDCEDEVYEEYNIPNVKFMRGEVNEEFEEYTITNENYDDTFNTPGVPTAGYPAVDTVDGGYRERSNSNISNSGSFRGDGSDPTDAQTLLSARELSDLIVGRYPSCKTVSNTLNSDSDYVTLPPNYLDFPPVPPKRVDSVDTRFRQASTDYMEPIYPQTPTQAAMELNMHSQTKLETRLRPPPPPYAPKNYERDPPPYPDNTPMLPPPPVYPTEETNARYIATTTAPNILTAFTSMVNVNNAPSYSQHYIPTNSSFSQSNFSQANSSFSKQSSSFSSAHNLSFPTNYAAPGYCNVPSNFAHLPPVPPKIPTIYTPNNYLDIQASKASVLVPCTYMPPPPVTSRQPPPAPPLATVYTSQLTRSQIEQYHQQMYSDVDFVVFPLKEPAISKQEYLEAKQGSLLAALAHQHVFYRSTPHLGPNLSDTYVQLPVYGAPSSTGSLDLVPSPVPPNKFMRTRSDDNILNSLELPPQCPKFRRLPPPPPPLPEKRHMRRTALGSLSEKRNPTSLAEKHLDSKLMHGRNKSCGFTMIRSPLTISERTPHKRVPKTEMVDVKQSEVKSEIKPDDSKAGKSPDTKNTPLDIRTLREKSKKMDLPLISALCNDRSLIKQTKAFVMPKHAGDLTPRVATNSKYPVSGLSSKGIINKHLRKSTNVSHRHPGDKLPEIPCEKITDIQRAKPNNYVITDPRPAGKHKSVQSHS